MKKYDVEMAIINTEGSIENWDSDAIQDYVEAIDAEEAMDFAKDYITECIINDGCDPDEVPIILRAREVIDASCGDYGDWVYNEM